LERTSRHAGAEWPSTAWARTPKLRDTSRAFIKIDNDELPPAAGGTAIRQQLRIIGTDVQVATALQLITDILTDNPTPNAAPAAAPALGCGAWASDAAIPSSTITATGSNASLSSSYSSSTSVPSADSGCLSAASTAVATSYAVARMIPKEQARPHIRPGGATIRRLRDASRAFIKIDNEDQPPAAGTTEPCQRVFPVSRLVEGRTRRPGDLSATLAPIAVRAEQCATEFRLF